ncbi:n-terminal kinase-like protein [Quercus suber]|uniref:N-terminal kinase-like protein n=1 Tax=Quercus suber TaxID=58331 RepID=A0AAW0KFW6_QUESU
MATIHAVHLAFVFGLLGNIVSFLVYPYVAIGFSDTSAFLRKLTLKSMLTLAPKLSQRTISGSLLKYLSKLQTRKRVLINAFTVRALCDTFSPARGAGIMALCATSAYYDVTEIATRILPNVIVLTIDPGRLTILQMICPLLF